MKKSLIALAVAGAMTVPAIAAADATLYGSFRMGMDFAKGTTLSITDFDTVDEEVNFNRSSKSAELKDHNSRIGIKGTVDLGLEDTKGIFLWEQGLNLNNGSLNANGGRYAHVGATGSWGTALGGKADHAHHSWVENYTAGVFKSGYYDENLYLANPFHKRVGNSLAYVSPDMNGFQAFVGGVFKGDGEYNGIAGTASKDGKDKQIDAYNVAVKYAANGFYGSGAFGAGKTAKQETGEYTVDVRTWGLAAGYNGIEGLDLRANYTQLKDKALDDSEKLKNYSLAAAYSLGDTTLSLRHSVVRVSDWSNPKTTQAEVSHKLGRGMIYANYIDFNTAAGQYSALVNGSEVGDDFIGTGKSDTFTLGYRLDF